VPDKKLQHLCSKISKETNPVNLKALIGQLEKLLIVEQNAIRDAIDKRIANLHNRTD
jgi:hypothetical protein